jgi:hypothetical protein
VLLKVFLNDFHIVPINTVMAGVTFVFILHIRFISIARSLYFIIFSSSLFVTLLLLLLLLLLPLLLFG